MYWFTKTAILLAMMIGIIRSQEDHQTELAGGPCEGCEAVFEYGDRILLPVDTLPDFFQEGTRLRITGTIYQSDGKTPASGVILYIYHTDQNGIYDTRGTKTGWGRRHGYIRGWVKTGPDGRYLFYTLKPGIYPNQSAPAHIHATILQPDGKYYWIGSYHFAGDSLLTKKEISPEKPRCGTSGLLQLQKEEDLYSAERDLILGKNVPGYK